MVTSQIVSEPLLRMAISNLQNAYSRIDVFEPLKSKDYKKITKLATAQNRIAAADRLIREFAADNGIVLRDTMKT
jgi:hypothetical protein